MRATLRAFRLVAGFALVLAIAGTQGHASKPSARQDLAQLDLSPDPLPPRRGSAAPMLPDQQLAPPLTTPLPVPLDRPSAPTARLGGDEVLILNGLRLIGGSVLDQPTLNAIAAPFLDRLVGTQDLEEIRQRVTLAYVNRGYVNSGAIIPDQTVADGVVVLQAVEGRLGEIELTGNRHYRGSYIADRLRRGLGVPFRVEDLERQQQILLQDPFISRLNLNIQPGLVPGEARLLGEVTEAFPYALTAQVANSQSPTVGEVRGQLQGIVGNLLGIGDIFALQYGRSAGLNDGAVSYSVPIASDDTRISLRYDVNSTLIVNQSLRALDITSRYHSVGIGVSRPFFRTAEQRLVLGVAGEWRRSRTFLLGEPFSFVAGAENGRTNVTALRLYQDWLDQSSEHVIAFRSTFSIGLAVLGATVTPARPSGQFSAWLGQGQYVRRLVGDWELLLRSSLQLSADPLFPIEQFVLGGISTVRGYREYLTATDNAFAGSIELRVPVAKLQLPYFSNTANAGTIQLVPFFDRGAGWNTRRGTPPRSHLSSTGLGVRWLIGPGTLAEIYYGYALQPARLDNTLQDQGIHFRIVSAIF